jgi:hypothetical protein
MRENRPYGSEGGVAEPDGEAIPTPMPRFARDVPPWGRVRLQDGSFKPHIWVKRALSAP